MTGAVISCIRFYQRVSRAYMACGFGSGALGGCRQWPTCSEYCIEALREHGFVRGSLRALIRILRCNPFTKAHVY